MDLPPLVLTQRDLVELVEAAGEDAHRWLSEEKELSTTEIQESAAEELVGASLKAPGFSISFGSDAERTLVSYEDQEERIQQVEQVLKRLESCRRYTSFLTHTDAAIIAGMLFPIAAGLLAPASVTHLACGGAAVVWMFYLWWVQHNAHYKWCVFR